MLVLPSFTVVVVVVVVAVAAVAAGCGSPETHDTTGGGNPSQTAPGGGVAPGGGAAPGGSEPVTSGPTAPASFCALQRMLQSRCQSCHAAQPLFGAPMPLVTVEDLRAPARTDPSKKVIDLVNARVRATGKPMPPPPAARLDASELSALDLWVKEGTPGDSQARCYPGPMGPPSPGLPPGSITPPGAELPPGDCAPERYLAHNAATPGDPTPFVVAPDLTNVYKCFYFKAPTPDPTHALAFKPVIDDARVIHHWLFYGTNRSGLKDGAIETCNGSHPNDFLLAGWAPGGPDMTMPPDVGLELPRGPNAFYVLEIHYSNGGKHPDADDRSGVEVCTTRNLRKNAAAAHWLGTETIFLLPGKGQAKSNCTPKNQTAPINIVFSTPHMHLLGTNLSTIINRKGGAKEPLIDKPFEFESQFSYKTPTVIMPGDTLTTTCSYMNSSGGLVLFGPKTEDEMCYNFVVAYPAGSLSSSGGITGNLNKCYQ